MTEDIIRKIRNHPLALHSRRLVDKSVITQEIEKWEYNGNGASDDPFIITWIDNDTQNPMLFSKAKKYSIALLASVSTLAVTFASSGYSTASAPISEEFGCSEEVFTLGLSLYVLGFAIGPVFWAPLSEVYGRRILFLVTCFGMTAFNAGAAASQNIWSLIIQRFLAGSIGSSTLTNSGGVIADMFPPEERGLGMAMFASAPFAGPVLGPIVGGFVSETIGWRWLQGIFAIFSGVMWILGALYVPETYAPVILRNRAARLSTHSDMICIATNDAEKGPKSLQQTLKTAIVRPWALLFMEPIVLLLSLYQAIMYGTLYLSFAAFPVVYQEARGWSPGIGGLAFLGVLVGIIAGLVYSIYENKRYIKVSRKHSGFPPPESRLPMCMVGAIAAPVGLFWFAWTNYPSIHSMASICAGVPFGFAYVLIALSVVNYLVDSYTIYAASVLAALSVIRSVFGAVFPLFTAQMYHNLGIHWASAVPAFLALACAPIPYLFYRYGSKIRKQCKYSANSDQAKKRMQGQKIQSSSAG